MVTANPTGDAAACDAAAVTAATLTAGLRAYGTTLHALPGGSYGVTETPFSPAALSASELMKLDQFWGSSRQMARGMVPVARADRALRAPRSSN